jgi:hypothetical protein
MTDSRGRQQLQNGIQHSKPRSQHGHNHHVFTHHTSLSRSKRRQHRARHRRDIAKRFGRKEDTDSIGRAPELGRRRSYVSKLVERVLHQRMLNDVERHGNYHSFAH